MFPCSTVPSAPQLPQGSLDLLPAHLHPPPPTSSLFTPRPYPVVLTNPQSSYKLINGTGLLPSISSNQLHTVLLQPFPTACLLPPSSPRLSWSAVFSSRVSPAPHLHPNPYTPHAPPTCGRSPEPPPHLGLLSLPLLKRTPTLFSFPLFGLLFAIQMNHF